MNRTLLPFAALALFTSILVACGGEKQAAPDAATSPASSPAPATSSSPKTAEIDLQFIDAMRMHHEAAVSMASMAAKRATDPKIRSMAARMAADQQKEIAQLTTWRDQWFAGAPPAASSTMPGASSIKMDMSHMEALSGHQFDMMFVDMMVPHHEGAVEMACEAHGRSTRDEIRQFARAVIRAQENEISDLAAWKQAMKVPGSAAATPREKS